MREYLQVLIWTMLFVVIIEMFFPSSDMKKYLKLVLGFIVVYIIISPMISVVTQISKGDALGGHVMYYQKALGSEPIYSGFEQEQIRQQESLREVYETQVTKQVEQTVERNLPVDVSQVEITMRNDEKDFAVQEVELVVSLKEEAGEIRVPKVKIGEKSESLTLSEGHLKEEVKKCLNDFYNWDNVNIHIIVDHK